jgi:hypothetical protein
MRERSRRLRSSHRRTIMKLQLPKPVAAYFTADTAGSEALSQCFTDDAVVTDEGHTHQSREAIRKWKEEASARYQYTIEPLACAELDGRVVVTNRISGNFPGSPVDLRFFFRLQGDKIASLEIRP